MSLLLVLAHSISAADIYLALSSVTSTGSIPFSGATVTDRFNSVCQQDSTVHDFAGLFGCTSCDGGSAITANDRLDAYFDGTNTYREFVSGAIIANNRAQLLAGPLAAVRAQTDGSYADGYTWTGLLADGSASSNDCNNWSPIMLSQGAIGSTYDASYVLYDSAVKLAPCTGSYNVLCFSVGAIGEGFGDPHFVGFNGAKFNFDGVAGNVYNILSTTSLQVNSRFIEADVNGLLGTWMGEVGINYLGHEVVVSPAGLLVEDSVLVSGTAKFGNGTCQASVTLGENGKPMAMSISTGDGVIGVQVEHSDNGESYLNIRVALHRFDRTTTHGILGQTARVSSEEWAGVEGIEENYLVADGILGSDFAFNQYTNTVNLGARSVDEPLVATFF